MILHLSTLTLIELSNFRYKINLHLQNIDNASKLNHSINKLTGFSAFTKVSDQFSNQCLFPNILHIPSLTHSLVHILGRNKRKKSFVIWVKNFDEKSPC